MSTKLKRMMKALDNLRGDNFVQIKWGYPRSTLHRVYSKECAHEDRLKQIEAMLRAIFDRLGVTPTIISNMASHVRIIYLVVGKNQEDYLLHVAHGTEVLHQPYSYVTPVKVSIDDPDVLGSEAGINKLVELVTRYVMEPSRV